MPLSFDWNAKGTLMLFVKRFDDAGAYQRSETPRPSSSNSNSQRPLSVCQSAGTKSGRGTSARGTAVCAGASGAQSASAKRATHTAKALRVASLIRPLLERHDAHVVPVVLR